MNERPHQSILMKSDVEFHRGMMAHLPDGALASLTDQQKHVVLTLLARVSEASYRRGAQHGAFIERNRPGDLPRDLWRWRYEVHQDRSPWLDRDHTEPASDRLSCEYYLALRDIALL
jgi:hypothetical protein